MHFHRAIAAVGLHPSSVAAETLNYQTYFDIVTLDSICMNNILNFQGGFTILTVGGIPFIQFSYKSIRMPESHKGVKKVFSNNHKAQYNPFSTYKRFSLPSLPVTAQQKPLSTRQPPLLKMSYFEVITSLRGDKVSMSTYSYLHNP